MKLSELYLAILVVLIVSAFCAYIWNSWLREKYIIWKTTRHCKRLYSDTEYYVRDKMKRGYKEDDIRMHWWILNGKCPDCHGKEWYEGPHGGMSINWYCANEECGSGFSIAAAWGDIITAERIGTWTEFKKRMNINE